MLTRNGNEIEPPLWDAFTEWADENSVSLDMEDDWGPWFDCFTAGVDAAIRAMNLPENNDE